MDKEKIDVPEEYIAKIRNYVKEGRFENFSDFFIQAARLLLMAEDNKEDFIKVMKKGD